jgi:uncharacterized protein (DUF952 family)
VIEDALVYKILSRADWAAALAAGEYRGSEHDARDGFIHFSRAHQLAATAAKYFAGRQDLVLLAIDVTALGPALRYEASRGGDLFPHLYATLTLSAVRWSEPLRWQDGAFGWPAKLG